MLCRPLADLPVAYHPRDSRTNCRAGGPLGISQRRRTYKGRRHLVCSLGCFSPLSDQFKSDCRDLTDRSHETTPSLEAIEHSGTDRHTAPRSQDRRHDCNESLNATESYDGSSSRPESAAVWDSVGSSGFLARVGILLHGRNGKIGIGGRRTLPSFFQASGAPPRGCQRAVRHLSIAWAFATSEPLHPSPPFDSPRQTPPQDLIAAGPRIHAQSPISPSNDQRIFALRRVQ